MKKQYTVTQLAYIDITIYAESEDEAKTIAEETVYSLNLKPDPDCEAISVSDQSFYDINYCHEYCY